MSGYKVFVSQEAKSDIDDIVTYLEEFSATTAKRYYNLFDKAIRDLATFPNGYPSVKHEKAREKGYRWTSVNNYMVFFRVFKEEKSVLVEHVCYGKMEYSFLLLGK